MKRVPEATEKWSDTKAIYRFWQNEKVRAADIIEALAFGCSRTAQRPASDFGDSRYDRFKLFSSLEEKERKRFWSLFVLISIPWATCPLGSGGNK